MKSKRSFEIQGHRGCRGLMPENTIEAFRKAIDLGVDSLELDVVISKDRKVVVSHDPFFNPQITTRPDGTFYKSERDSNLYLMDYEGIRQHDVGQRGNADFQNKQKLKLTNLCFLKFSKKFQSIYFHKTERLFHIISKLKAFQTNIIELNLLQKNL